MTTPSPHDALFKTAFTDPVQAASLLRSQLPEALASRIDWSTLVTVPGSFVDDALGERHTDLLFSCKMDGREVLLYVLLEHQSTEDPWMALRVLRYVVRVWDRWLVEHPEARGLPPVVPIVVHHGLRPWSRSVQVMDLVEMDDELRGVLAPHLPKLAFLLDDLASASDTALEERGLVAFSELVLRALSRLPNHATPLSELIRMLPLLRRVLRRRAGLQRLRAFFEYVHHVTDVEPTAVRRVVRRLGAGAEELYMSTAQKLIEKGRAEGRSLGLDEGRSLGLDEGRSLGLDEGRSLGLDEGQTTALLRFLEGRFGALPSDVASRVRSASREQREVWLDRVVHAESLDAVFDG